MIDLSVVLISKNQAWNIARLIQSVLDETSCVLSREIVLVDSASTDRTIEIALDYPIGILRLHPNQRLTPNAGRYVGYKYTSGKFVLFLDGDMELYNGWLEKALAVMQSVPDVAVVAGSRIDQPIAAQPVDKAYLQQPGIWDNDIEVKRVGGAAIYRRPVLEQVGTFNPWLYSDEEPELCLRVRHAGYRILQLGHTIVYHYTDPIGAISTLIGRWRRNLYLGQGQCLRYHLGTKIFWSFILERGYGCIPAIVLAVGFTSFVISIATFRWIWFGGWWLLSVLTLLVIAIRKRSLHNIFRSVVFGLIVLDGLVRGFILKPLNPMTYPARFDVVKE